MIQNRTAVFREQMALQLRIAGLERLLNGRAGRFRLRRGHHLQCRFSQQLVMRIPGDRFQSTVPFAETAFQIQHKNHIGNGFHDGLQITQGFRQFRSACLRSVISAMVPTMQGLPVDVSGDNFASVEIPSIFPGLVA